MFCVSWTIRTLWRPLNVWECLGVYFLRSTAIPNLPIPPLSTKIVLLNLRILGDQTQYRLSLVTMHWETPWWAHSDVGLPVDEYRAACEGSIHFDLFLVGHRNQHVVLQLLEHLQDTDRAVTGKKLYPAFLNYSVCNVFLDIIKLCQN